MRLLAALLASLALGSGVGRAFAGTFAAPAPPTGIVAPGDEVVTALPALPAGSYEFELFLVPESGAPIRVSAELRAGAREVRWRVPAVAAHRARLVLRAGDEDEERESMPSASFELAGLPASETALLLRGRSEAGARLESSAGAAGAGLSAGPGSPSLEPGRALACAVTTSASQSLATPLENTVTVRGFSRHDASPIANRRVRSNNPAFIPLRS